MKTTRAKFHAELKAAGIEFTTSNVDGLGTALSNDFTDIIVHKDQLEKLETFCKTQRRSCIWPVVGLHNANLAIRRVTLYE